MNTQTNKLYDIFYSVINSIFYICDGYDQQIFSKTLFTNGISENFISYDECKFEDKQWEQYYTDINTFYKIMLFRDKFNKNDKNIVPIPSINIHYLWELIFNILLCFNYLYRSNHKFNIKLPKPIIHIILSEFILYYQIKFNTNLCSDSI